MVLPRGERDEPDCTAWGKDGFKEEHLQAKPDSVDCVARSEKKDTDSWTSCSYGRFRENDTIFLKPKDIWAKVILCGTNKRTNRSRSLTLNSIAIIDEPKWTTRPLIRPDLSEFTILKATPFAIGHISGSGYRCRRTIRQVLSRSLTSPDPTPASTNFVPTPFSGRIAQAIEFASSVDSPRPYAKPIYFGIRLIFAGAGSSFYPAPVHPERFPVLRIVRPFGSDLNITDSRTFGLTSERGFSANRFTPTFDRILIIASYGQ